MVGPTWDKYEAQLSADCSCPHGKGSEDFYVTHMFDFAGGIYRLRMDGALFLGAERLGDGPADVQTDHGRTATGKLWRGLVSPNFRI
jgi:hypothetical protein